MVSLLRTLIGEDIALDLVCDEGLWSVEVDAHQLENVVMNIVVNSRDAMPGGGTLTIEASNTTVDEIYAQAASIEQGHYARISITDDGVGMEPDVLEKAFEPFFTTKRKGEGTGLGLAMAHGFVRQSNGHIRIWSDPGQGTTVRIYLPRAGSTAASAVVEDERVGDPRAKKKRILVVEDDAEFRRTITAMLSSSGYSVVAAEHAAEALSLLETSGPFDVLLSDVVLPGGMNGRQLAEAVADDHPDMKVLFMSGYSEDVVIHHGRLDPGVILLQKPFRRVDLIREIVRLTD